MVQHHPQNIFNIELFLNYGITFFTSNAFGCFCYNKEGRRYEDNQENRAIFNMKIKALKVMNLFFNFRLYLRLQVWDTLISYLHMFYSISFLLAFHL